MTTCLAQWKQVILANLLTASLCAAGMMCSRAALSQDEKLIQVVETLSREGEPQLKQLSKRLTLEVQVMRETQERLRYEGENLIQSTLDQLSVIDGRAEEGTEPLMTAGDLQTNSQLIGNCLTELQRIQWEEATEEGFIGDAKSFVVSSDLERERIKLASAIRVAEGDLEHLREQHTRIKELYERASVAVTQLQEHSAKISHSEAVLNGLKNELKMVEESVNAASNRTVLAAKQRLAQLRSRKKAVLEQLQKLQARQTHLKQLQFKEQSLSRVLEQAFRLSENEVPMRIKLAEAEVLLRAVEKELAAQKPAVPEPEDEK